MSTMEEEDHWPLTDTRLRRKSSFCCVLASVLGVLLVAAVLAIIGLGVGIKLEHDQIGSKKAPPTSSSSLHPSPTPSPTPSPALETCYSPECVELSEQILSKLDRSVDPCDNFYKFACNRFLNESIIPYGYGAIDPITSTADLIVERSRVALQAPITSKTSLTLTKAMTLYQSCMNTSLLESRAVEDLTNLIKKLGGWPLVGIPGEDSSPWDINSDHFLKELLYGSGSFFVISVAPDRTNSTRNVLEVDQSGLTIFDQSFYQPDSSLKTWVEEEVVKLLQTINSSVPVEMYNSTLRKIFDFERELANITDFNSADNRTNYMNYTALQLLMPVFNWTHNLKRIGKMGGFSVGNLSTAHVNVLAPQYLMELSELINRTDNMTLQNYAKWRLLYSLLPYLSNQFSNFYVSLLKKLGGDPAPPRYKMCVGKVEAELQLPLSLIYAENYLPENTISNLTEMVTQLKEALKERISEKTWLDSSTKKQALEKLQAINDLLAYPETIKNDTYLNQHFKKLDVNSSYSYLVNTLNVAMFDSLANLRHLGDHNNRSLWGYGLLAPTVVNAFYYTNLNQIYIFEGILNVPFFKTYWPDYFKYGTIGFVVGHELTHGFDSNGRHYNQFGNAENWWSKTAEANFTSKANCLIQQYSNYTTIGNFHVNGTLTLPENIADNGGLNTAFRAYKNLLKKTGRKEMLLPGMSYTPEQLFFIGTTQPWCQALTVEKQEQLLADTHSPNSVRPIGFLSNSPDFAKAFKCRNDSKMNPAKKCEVW